VGEFAQCSSLNLLSKKKMDMIILGILPAHHTPNLMSHTSTVCIYVANEVKPCFICKKNVSTGLTSPLHTASQVYSCNTVRLWQFLHDHKFAWFQTQQFCGCMYRWLWYTGFLGQPSAEFYGDASTCTPNYLMFLLKDYVVISIISSLTRHLMTAVCSAVNILLILIGIKHWKTNF